MISLKKLQFGNGAGSVKTLEDVHRAAMGPSTRITVGSITKEPRAGNTGDVYYFHPQDYWSMNSLGLPNIGFEAYGPIWRDIIAMAKARGKELWVSISPFSAQECGEMTDRLLCMGVDGVEINGSCPNIWSHGKRKAIPALDPEAAEEMFHILGGYVGDLEFVSFKLSPTRDESLLEKLALVLHKYEVNQLVCCNTIPDQERERVDGKPALSFRSAADDTTIKHTGGLAGAAALEESLFVTATMRRLVPVADIIGIGGIFNFTHAELYLELGWVGFQSTTGYLEFGERLWTDILMGLNLETT